MYYNSVTFDNITYSIDMIRLKTHFNFFTFSEIEFRFNTCYKHVVAMKWTSDRYQDFFYNYRIKFDDDTSFYFGYCHNTEKRNLSPSSCYNFTIEFNPNKLKDNRIILWILSLTGEWYIKSYDLAMDLKISILDLLLDTSGRQIFDTRSFGYDNKTYTCGKGDGRYKVYNKKIESSLNCPGDLTRVEVSRTFDDYPVCEISSLQYDGNFPNIYLNQYLYTFNDYKDVTLLAVLYAVQNGFPIKDLTRSYKVKIKKLLNGGYKINFDSKSATLVLNKTIFSYFLKNPNIHFK